MKTRWMMVMLTVGLLGMVQAVPSQAAIPPKIAFQGKLTDLNGQPLGGSHTMTFRLYDAASGGTKLWEETQTLTLSAGLFSTLLGDVTPLTLSFDKPYWVEIQVGTEVLAPRQPLGTSPYAFRAQHLEGLNIVGGNVGIGTTTPLAMLQINQQATDTSGNQLRLVNTRTGGNSFAFGVGDNTSPAAVVTPGGFYIYDSNGNATRVMIKNDGNVGIGTTTPNAKLEINQGTAGAEVSRFEGNFDTLGNVDLATFRRVGGAVAAAMRYVDADTDMSFGTTTGHRLNLMTGGTDRLTIDSVGNVGIGATGPENTLHVAKSTSAGIGGSLYLDNTAASALSNETQIAFGNDVGASFAGVSGARLQSITRNASSGAASFQIDTWDGAAEAARIYINEVGNVGIGTTAPTAKLDVNGAARLAPIGAPASPTPGTVYFNSADKHFYGFDGTAWKQLDN